MTAMCSSRMCTATPSHLSLRHSDLLLQVLQWYLLDVAVLRKYDLVPVRGNLLDRAVVVPDVASVRETRCGGP